MNGMFNVNLNHYLSEKIIPLRLNSTGVGESSWAFKNTFNISEEELATANIDLVFEGVDTFAAIILVSPS
jgi:hypothetical protein